MTLATGTRPTLHGIQVLRGLAAMAVVIHHTMEEAAGVRVGGAMPDWLITAGAAGVDVFFVISGFIMLHVAFPDTGAPIAPGRFLWRRAMRIYPLYWLCCLAVVALGTMGFFATKSFSFDSILQSMLLVPTAEPLLTVSWTLVHEVLFYAVFASTLLVRSRVASVLLCAVALLALLAIGQILPPGPTRGILGNPVALEFCLGLGLAWLFHHRRYSAPLAWWWAWPASAMLLAAPVMVPHAGTGGLDGFPRLVAWGLPAAVIVAASLGFKHRETWLGRALVKLGDASYAVYLTHVFVMIAYARLLKSTPLGDASQWMIMPLVVVVAGAVGLTTHLLVERRLTGQKALRAMPRPLRQRISVW
jgi:exopolysaccharide production protein ExoZ